MEQPLSRSASSESAQSWRQLSSASGASAAGRKAKSSEPETGGDNVERPSVSVPLLGRAAIRQSLPARRPSKASDSSLFEYFGHAWSGSAVDDSDQATPTLESTQGSLASAPVNPLLLPDSFRHARSDAGTAAATESKRLSISSFVSAISNRGYSWSGRSSLAGSESEARMENPHGTTTATSSLSVTTSSQNGSLGTKTSPTQLLFPQDHQAASNPSASPNTAPAVHPASPHTSQPPLSGQPRRSRSRTAQRRISGSTATSSSPASRDMREKKQTKGIIGVCATMPDPRTYMDMALPLVKTLPECADYFKTVEPFLPQYYNLPYKVAAHIADPQALKALYVETNPLMTALAFATMFVTPVVLAVSEINRNYSQVDRLWSLLPAIYNVHYAVWAHLNGLPTMKLDHVMAVSIIWGARLTFNYWRKGGYQVGSEDYRWNIVKDYVGGPGMFIFNVTFISLGQNILLWLITTPTYILLLANRLQGNDVTSYDSLFGRSMLAIVVLEFFADQAQWNYHKAKGAYQKTAKVPSDLKYTREQLDRGFNTTGLFAWSRHPNFAAEQAFWVCLYQWCCLETETYANWSAAGAFGYLILFQASTWLTELLSAGKYPEYKVYQERVGKFLPKFGTKSMELPQTEKEKQKVKDAKAGKGAMKTK